MNAKAAALAALCLFLAKPESVCVHPAGGATGRISLEAVRRAQESVRERFERAALQAGRLPAQVPFDSGLPGCRGRRTRVERGEFPRELVGKTIAFARADRMPRADIRVATSCRRLSEVEADALADPDLAGRLRVRCEPTRVRILSEVELELVEDP
jgi:hypothetical protein